MSEARIDLLEVATTASTSCMNHHSVVSMTLHYQRFVAGTLKMGDMVYVVLSETKREISFDLEPFSFE